MRKIAFLISTVSLLTAFSACKGIEDKVTTLEIVDNNRHYYPILQGQKLDIIFDVKNIGENPFILTDLITSCGCLKLKKSSVNSIPAKREGKLVLTYDSNKNIGLVEHYITLYGNFETSEYVEITFDVHVVPDAHYTKDYEELYLEERSKKGNLKGAVEGEEQNRGYYMDGDF